MVYVTGSWNRISEERVAEHTLFVIEHDLFLVRTPDQGVLHGKGNAATAKLRGDAKASEISADSVGRFPEGGVLEPGGVGSVGR